MASIDGAPPEISRWDVVVVRAYLVQPLVAGATRRQSPLTNRRMTK